MRLLSCLGVIFLAACAVDEDGIDPVTSSTEAPEAEASDAVGYKVDVAESETLAPVDVDARIIITGLDYPYIQDRLRVAVMLSAELGGGDVSVEIVQPTFDEDGNQTSMGDMGGASLNAQLTTIDTEGLTVGDVWHDAYEAHVWGFVNTLPFMLVPIWL